jgi:hypothetical protein
MVGRFEKAIFSRPVYVLKASIFFITFMRPNPITFGLFQVDSAQSKRGS